MMGSQQNAAERIPLNGGRHLQLRQESDKDCLKIVNADGRVAFTIELSDSGPVFRFESEAISIQSSGKLSLEADALALHAERNLSLSSHGDITVTSRASIHSEANAQNIIAREGNVDVHANDDVKLNGERVLVNYPIAQVSPKTIDH